MRNLAQRLSALERRDPAADLAVLSDADLTVRLVPMLEALESREAALPCDWRGMINRGDFAKLEAAICEIR